MGKDKLRRFAELETFDRVFQPKGLFLEEDHELKGRWNEIVFGNDHPLILELGCGRGEYTVNMAKLFPEKNFIGIDKKGARLWRGAKTGHEESLVNTAFLRVQIERLKAFFKPGEVDEIWITFPDPQPQQTRENMRMTSQRFIDMYKVLLKPGGIFHLKTDSNYLYEYTLEKLKANNIMPDLFTNDVYNLTAKDPVLEIKTTYELRFLNHRKKICYLKATFLAK